MLRPLHACALTLATLALWACAGPADTAAGVDGGPVDAGALTADGCSWPPPSFWSTAPAPTPTLQLELGQRAIPFAPWQPLVTGASLPMLHGFGDSYHSFAMFRVDVPGAKPVATPQGSFVTVQAEAWLAHGCEIIAAGGLPSGPLWSVGSTTQSFGNTERGEFGLPLFFSPHGPPSSRWAGGEATLVVRVRAAGTSSWGQVARRVVLVDTQPLGPGSDASATDAVGDTDSTDSSDASDAAEVDSTDDLGADGADAGDAGEETSGGDGDGDSDGDGDGDGSDSGDAATPDASGDSAAAGSDDAAGDGGDSAALPFEPTLTEQPGPYQALDPATLPPAPFTDITVAMGLSPTKTAGACVAAGDLDNDGDDDFVVIDLDVTKAKVRAVLLQAGAATHVLTNFDTTVLLPSTGCSLADMNADGKLDLLVGGHSGAALLLGDGKGGFSDVSETWLPYFMDFATLTIAPVDIDGDGDLDVFVGAGVTPVTLGGGGPACGAMACGFTDSDFICKMKFPFPEGPGELQDRMLIRGPKLPLTDATATWKVPPGGLWSNAFPIDLDMDGKIDVLVGDDFGAHRYLRNLGGAFEAFATDIGFHDYGHAMGWGVGDFNADGKPDLVMADAGPTPAFVQVAPAAGKPVGFADKGGAFGIWGPSWTASSWSPMVQDFDHDGKDDVMLGISIATTVDEFPGIASGCAGGAGPAIYQGHPNADLIFLSGAGSPFGVYRFPSGPISHFAMVTHVALDLDGDGDLDLVQSRPNINQTGMLRVLRNDIGTLVNQAGVPVQDTKPKAIVVRIKGKGGNLDAIGARVTATIQGTLRTRWLSGSGGTGGTRSRMAHFGLGGGAQADAVTVHWPDGKTTALGSVAAGKTVLAVWP